MATDSSILAWRMPWTEEPGGLQSTGSPRVGHNRAADTHFHTGETVHGHLTGSWKEGGVLWGAEGAGLWTKHATLMFLQPGPRPSSCRDASQRLDFDFGSPETESESRSVVSDSLRPRGLCSPCNSPGQNSGMGSLSLLQGIFPTQGSNPGLLHCRRVLYQLSHQGSPRNLSLSGL